MDWYKKYGIKNDEYFLIVGRFVPENNYETMITEFMKSGTKKDLVIISNIEKNKFYYHLLEKTHFDNDERIKFVGTVYDQELLKKIREEAFAYIHGHSVGGTNPSLLEALTGTKINLLYDVEFNKEVACDYALYWNKNKDDLKNLIDQVDNNPDIQSRFIGKSSYIESRFAWNLIIQMYEEVFHSNYN